GTAARVTYLYLPWGVWLDSPGEFGLNTRVMPDAFGDFRDANDFAKVGVLHREVTANSPLYLNWGVCSQRELFFDPSQQLPPLMGRRWGLRRLRALFVSHFLRSVARLARSASAVFSGRIHANP